MWTRITSSHSYMVMRFALVIALSCLALGSSCQHRKADAYESLRKAMVDQQIVLRGISDPRVINAMLKVPRHLFVPERYRYLAYADTPLPIGAEQTISQPYIVALMTEELALESADRVLEVGTGSGYQAAILAEIASEVYTIEIIEMLGKGAENVLDSLGYSNVKVMIGDGYEGWPEYAPFDKIIVTCAPEEIPQPLVDQLKEGGLMVIPVGSAGFQYLYRVRKYAGHVEPEKVTPVSFVPLTGPHGR
jgi:protein-L-isoaspartate(D-aspartate) O-methyltransferase